MDGWLAIVLRKREDMPCQYLPHSPSIARLRCCCCPAPQENLPEKSVKKFHDVKGCDEAIGELQVCQQNKDLVTYERCNME